MWSHIEQTVAGQRDCLMRRILPTLSRLLAVWRYAFRVGPDASTRTPRLWLHIWAVKRVIGRGLMLARVDPAFGASGHR